jgi:hypothetical protein
MIANQNLETKMKQNKFSIESLLIVAAKLRGNFTPEFKMIFIWKSVFTPNLSNKLFN